MSLTRQEKLEAARLQQEREAEFQMRLQEALNAPDAAEAELMEQSSPLTPEQAARAEYEPPEERPEGFITQAGEALDYVVDGGLTSDALNAAAAGINQITPEDSFLKPLTQGADDFLLSRDEQEAQMDAQITDRIGSDDPAQRIRGRALQALRAGEAGSDAGLLAPLTLGGRALGQSTPWSNKPAVLDGSPVSDAVFNIAEVLIPSLITAGVAPGLSTVPGFVAAESAVETGLTAESPDDLITSRAVARAFGELADYIEPGSGGQVTAELLAGQTPTSHIFTASLGFLENLGINIGINQVIKYFAKGADVPVSPEVAETAKITGKSEQAVQKSIDNVTEPNYSSLSEPSEALSVANDTDVPVSKPSLNEQLDDSIALGGDPETVLARDRQTAGAAFDEFKQGVQRDGVEGAADRSTAEAIAEREQELAELQARGGEEAQVKILKRQIRLLRQGKNPYGTGNPTPGKNQYINPDALTAESLRKMNLDDEFLTAGDRKYFDTVGNVTNEVRADTMIREATKSFEKLTGRSADEAVVVSRVSSWWDENRYLFDDPADDVAFGVAAQDFAMSFATQNPSGRAANIFKQPGQALPGNSPEYYLREYASLEPAGFAATALIGEELGVRSIKLARIANNLDENGIDFSNVIDQLVEMNDRIGTFMVPVRRTKLQWSASGVFQSKKGVRKLKDVDVRNPAKQDPLKASSDSPAREFEVIRRNETDPGNTLQEIWDAYQAGDVEAGKTLKEYLKLLASSDPSGAASQVVKLSGTLEEAVKKGTTDAVKQLRYASMLGRIATQVVAAGNTIGRLVAEPIGSIASPLLAGGKGSDALYGLGQLIGGVAGLPGAIQASGKAFRTGVSINSGSSRFDGLITDIKVKRAQLDAQWKGLNQQWTTNQTPAADRVTATAAWLTKSWALHPINSLATRGLTASDEFGKSIFGSQVAMGRAFEFAAKTGTWGDVGRQANVQLNNIFRDGLRDGKIIDADVLEAAKNLTFQTQIPQQGNLVDKGFKKLQDAADESAFWSFFFPFTKAAYNTLEVAARYSPDGSIRRMIPRYNNIMKGVEGEAQKQQLQAQISLGRMMTMGGVTLGVFGLGTGYNPPPGVPRTSILIPADNEDGYIAVPYGRLEPFASVLGVSIDLANSFRSGAISEGDYARAIDEMTMSIGMATFDKTFVRGMLDLASLMNFRNYSNGGGQGISKNVGNILGNTVFTPGGQASALTRMILNWSNPYQTINRDKANGFMETFRSINSRYAGGVGNPIQYNAYTGEPVMKVGDPGGNYFQKVMTSVLNEIGYPGSVTAGKLTDAQKTMDKLGFQHDEKSALSTYEGIPLSGEQQSKLQKALHDKGELNDRLDIYFESKKYKGLRQRMKRAQGNDILKGDTSKGTIGDVARQEIFSDLRNIHRLSKRIAADAVLVNDPDFVRMRQEKQAVAGQGQGAYVPEPSGLAGETQGLIQWATGNN